MISMKMLDCARSVTRRQQTWQLSRKCALAGRRDAHHETEALCRGLSTLCMIANEFQIT